MEFEDLPISSEYEQVIGYAMVKEHVTSQRTHTTDDSNFYGVISVEDKNGTCMGQLVFSRDGLKAKCLNDKEFSPVTDKSGKQVFLQYGDVKAMQSWLGAVLFVDDLTADEFKAELDYAANNIARAYHSETPSQNLPISLWTERTFTPKAQRVRKETFSIPDAGIIDLETMPPGSDSLPIGSVEYKRGSGSGMGSAGFYGQLIVRNKSDGHKKGVEIAAITISKNAVTLEYSVHDSPKHEPVIMCGEPITCDNGKIPFLPMDKHEIARLGKAVVLGRSNIHAAVVEFFNEIQHEHAQKTLEDKKNQLNRPSPRF